jgi:hypothetical protein
MTGADPTGEALLVLGDRAMEVTEEDRWTGMVGGAICEPIDVGADGF